MAQNIQILNCSNNSQIKMSVNYQTPLSLELIEQSTSLCITCGSASIGTN